MIKIDENGLVDHDFSEDLSLADLSYICHYLQYQLWCQMAETHDE